MQSMNRILIALFLLLSVPGAAGNPPIQRLHAVYDISYAIFGSIGTADALLTIDPKQHTYRITIKARAKGIAKLMSNRRIERYESRGHLQNGLLVPALFITSTRKGKYFHELHRYRFNHAQKEILHQKRIQTKEETIVEDAPLSYYAKDDILTLFFNLHRYAREGICPQMRCSLQAVGANDKDGVVDINPAQNGMLKVILHRRIFASRQGEIYLHLTKEGISDYAMLKDVIFFGDVKAKATTIEKK